MQPSFDINIPNWLVWEKFCEGDSRAFSRYRILFNVPYKKPGKNIKRGFKNLKI
jgi:hypothetical protein